MNDFDSSNTEATENKVQFLNFAYKVKGFQCHSNNSLQLLELKGKKNNNKKLHTYVQAYTVLGVDNAKSWYVCPLNARGEHFSPKKMSF